MSEPKSSPRPPPPTEPVRFYTEEELDEIEKTDPERAYRIARAQAQALRNRRPTAATAAEAAGPPDPARVREAVEDVRAILVRDGGDIELVAIEGSVVRVRMKGACAGCPHSVIDLKNVVERIVGAVPGVTEVRNVF
jgi:Fe-S cluster biogenesis protein NfuA